MHDDLAACHSRTLVPVSRPPSVELRPAHPPVRAPLRVQVLIKDILDWLDRYLGPVKTAG